MSKFVALLRGVNVGKAKRVAMADLREALTGAGYGNVRTLLNSGNVVFEAEGNDVAEHASTIERLVFEKRAVSSRVVVISATALLAAVSENPLMQAEASPSRFLVAFPMADAAIADVQPLVAQDWSPDVFAVGRVAAYLAFSESVLGSPLATAVGRACRDQVTMRNWATVCKLCDMVR